MTPSNSTVIQDVRQCDTMYGMDELTPDRGGVGSTITVRLDSRTDNRLRVVAELLTEQDELGREVTVSQVVRAGIDLMYEKHATLEGND